MQFNNINEIEFKFSEKFSLKSFKIKADDILHKRGLKLVKTFTTKNHIQSIFNIKPLIKSYDISFSKIRFVNW